MLNIKSYANQEVDNIVFSYIPIMIDTEKKPSAKNGADVRLGKDADPFAELEVFTRLIDSQEWMDAEDIM